MDRIMKSLMKLIILLENLQLLVMSRDLIGL